MITKELELSFCLERCFSEKAVFWAKIVTKLQLQADPGFSNHFVYAWNYHSTSVHLHIEAQQTILSLPTLQHLYSVFCSSPLLS